MAQANTNVDEALKWTLATAVVVGGALLIGTIAIAWITP